MRVLPNQIEKHTWQAKLSRLSRSLNSKSHPIISLTSHLHTQGPPYLAWRASSLAQTPTNSTRAEDKARRDEARQRLCSSCTLLYCYECPGGTNSLLNTLRPHPLHTPRPGLISWPACGCPAPPSLPLSSLFFGAPLPPPLRPRLHTLGEQ